MFDPVHITEHMDVISKDFKVVGKVDRMDGADVIKLTKTSSPTGSVHHFIPTSWIDRVDQHVHLNKTGEEIVAHWLAEPMHFQSKPEEAE
jgi:hypothetical protein